MRRLILLIAFLSAITIQAQTLKVTIGPEITTKQVILAMDVPKLKPIKMTDLVPDGHFFDIASRRTFTKFAFSKKNFMYSENFITPTGNRAFVAEVADKESEKISVHRLLNRDKSLFIIYQKPKEENGKYSVYVNVIDKDLKVLGTPILLHTFEPKTSSSAIQTALSEDRKRLLVYRYLVGAQNQLLIEYKLMDENFSELSNKEIALYDKDINFEPNYLRIDNLGNIYIIGNRQKGKERKSKEESSSMLVYYSVTAGLKIHKIGFDQGENFGIKFELVNGIPYVVGLNKNQKEVRYFVSTLDPQTGEERKLTNKQMPENFYKTANIGGYETDHWRVAAIVGLKNGNLVASVEAIVTQAQARSFFSYNAFLISVTPTGEEKFKLMINKNQGGMVEFVGHALLSSGDKTFFIYNDHSDNMKLAPDNKNVKGYLMKDAMVTVLEIDADGKAIKYPFSKDPAFVDYSISVADLVKLKDNLYFTSANKRKSIINIINRNLIIEFE